MPYRIKCKADSLKTILDTGKVIKEKGEEYFYSFYLDVTADIECDNLIEL